MKINSLISACILSVLSASSFANSEYTLNSNMSSISFTTVKNQYVIERYNIDNLQGSIDKKGNFNISINLSYLNSSIPIRDSRMNELFFETSKFPSVNIEGNFDFSKLSENSVGKITVPAEVTMYGHTKRFIFPVVLSNKSDTLTIASYSPVIVQAEDFGIPRENLIKLAETVGGIKISSTVPINMILIFEK
ncbi:YceI family protein [Vibrio vulnificus]|uniref:YceI family protein n=1 Tax=Vibrio vulnificus TaxID=672 RepID=UPI001CDCE628|nr:YceI family protein [Vibrio vulnificus]MCA3966641.1 YceI family protein [Vibrio vulnificus]